MTMTYTPLHSPSLYDRAEEQSKFGNGVITSMLCAATLEAFLHDLCGFYEIALNNKKKNDEFKSKNRNRNRNAFSLSIFNSLTEAEEKILALLVEQESNKQPTVKKYDELFQHLILSAPQDYTQKITKLFEIRNGIVHMKSETFEVTRETLNSKSREYKHRLPTFLRDFHQQKMLLDINKPHSWIESIETEKFSGWCLNATKLIIDKIRESLPKTAVSEIFVSQTQL